MKNDAQKFMDCLDDAEHMLEGYPAINQFHSKHRLSYTSPEHFNLALFEKWSDFCEPEAPQKQPIRIIQHLSCTGGTLISKFLAAMPNVVLLNEVNPLSQLHLDPQPRF